MDPIDLLVEQIVRKLAYNLWCKRGCPVGSPEIDWRDAEEILYHAFLVNFDIHYDGLTLVEELEAGNTW
jgi:hypothetical protein